MKAHRTDGVSLVFALLFLAIISWWTVGQIFDLPLPAVGWFLAGSLILVGVLGLFGALRSGRAGARQATVAGTGTDRSIQRPEDTAESPDLVPPVGEIEPGQPA